MQIVDKPQPRTNINLAKLTVHVYTVDRAWLALKVTCNRDREKGHTKSEVNTNISL